MLKALTGELVNEVVQACQQFHGGMGYMRGTRDRAALARRARAGDRRRRHRGDARRSGQALLMPHTVRRRAADAVTVRPRLATARRRPGREPCEEPMPNVLRIERSGPVARVWLDRPDVRNAFNDALIAELAAAFADFAADAGVRAIVLGGRGKAFCAGADLTWMREMADYTWEQNRADAAGAGRDAVDALQLPGAGGRPHPRRLLRRRRRASPRSATCWSPPRRATFCLSEARLGLLPATISPYVVRAMGEQAARRYFVTAERFGAARGAGDGLRPRGRAPPTRSTPRSTSSSPRWSPTGRWRRAPARSWSRTSPAGRSRRELRAETARRIADIRASDEGREGVQSFLREAQAGVAAEPSDAMNARPHPARSRSPPRSAGPAGCGSTRCVFLTGAAGCARLGRAAAAACSCCRTRGCSAPAACMLFVEFFADKIPGLDTVWDMVHTRDPHPGRRGARGGGVRRRRGHLDDGGGAARRRASPPPATSPRRPPAPPSTPRPSRSRTSPCRCSATAWCRSCSGCRGRIRCCSSSPSASLCVAMVATIWVLGRFLRRAAQRRGLALSSADASRRPQRGAPMSALPSRVTLVDVGPRDGLQNEKQPVDAARQDRAGAPAAGRRADARSRSPASSARSGCRRWPTTPQVMAGIERKPGVRYSVLTPNMKGLDAALAAPRAQWPDEVVVFAAASEAFSQRNINCSIAESIERFRPVVEAAHDAGHQGARRDLVRARLPVPGRGHAPTRSSTSCG